MSIYPQNLAIIGKGAIGGLLAYRCQILGLNHQLLLKTDVKFHLNFEDIQGNKHRLSPDTSNINTPSDFDIVVIPTKAYQVIPALNQLGANIQKHHILVLLHNGMGTIEQVKRLYPNNPIIAATTSYGAFKPNDASLKETGLGDTHFGWITPPNTQCQKEVECRLSKLLPPSTWHQDINLALWKKLAINAVINPLTAIHNIKNGNLIERQYVNKITALCQEIAIVMNASGYVITADNLRQNIKTVVKATANNYSSMHQDLANKRQTEIDFINGYVVQIGQSLGIETPQNLQLHSEIKTLEDSTNTL